jgi:hypothetical protein
MLGYLSAPWRKGRIMVLEGDKRVYMDIEINEEDVKSLLDVATRLPDHVVSVVVKLKSKPMRAV